MRLFHDEGRRDAGACVTPHLVYKSVVMLPKNATENIAADVIDALGGVAKTAAIFGTSKTAVYGWRKRRAMPPLKLAAAALLMLQPEAGGAGVPIVAHLAQAVRRTPAQAPSDAAVAAIKRYQRARARTRKV